MKQELLQLSYYELFGLPTAFIVDINQLKNSMRALQQEYHPDNFVNGNEHTSALAISSHINHAYQTLINPLNRTLYLLGLFGVGVDLVHETKFAPEFLIQQIETREEIDDAFQNEDFDALSVIEEQLKQQIRDIEIVVAKFFETQQYDEITELVKKLSFYSKLLTLVDEKLSQL